MRIFKFMMLALVAMVGLNSCSDDCNHEFIEHDFTQDIVGTWTYLEEGQAEAMVIKEDGSFIITGVMNGGIGALYEEKGTVKVVNNKVTLAYNSGDVFEGRLELVAGKSLSIVLNEGYDIRLIYNYCANDLADEIVGMWVCNDYSTGVENDMVIQTFKEDGTVTKTGWSAASNEFIVNETITYKVVGDLVFHQRPSDIVTEGATAHFVSKLTYMPNANQLGDMLTNTSIKVINGEAVKLSASMLRVKQNLNLTNKLYAYNTTYVTNAKGADEDFNILGHNFNMANIANGNFDMLFRSELFCVIFPNANIIKQIYRSNGQDVTIDIPISVEGNKVTLDMSTSIPVLRKVDMYMFQDADDTQLHMYMPTQSFINYFANIELYTLIAQGKLDPTDAAAVAKVYADMEARVESINVSFVMKATQPAE